MTPDYLSRLKAAGVWPEGLIYREIDPPFREHFWREQGGIVAEQFARALLIDRMMDELPLQWYMKPVESEAPDPDHGRRWRVDSHRIVDRFLPSYPDKFEALFQALVASGRVK